MRETCFSAGRTSHSGRTGSSRSTRSNASHSLLQRKRTLDEFPMDHSFQDTHRLFQERRDIQAKQRLNLISTNGESKQLSSYSRRRFETALTIKGDESLPPPSPAEKALFWEDATPPWTHRRHLSMSAKPVSKPIELSPRPGSGPPVVTVAEGIGGRGGREGKGGLGLRGGPGGRPAFNHLRGNNSAYPTIQRLLKESNTEYRVVCPTSDCHYDRCRRPSVDCSSKSDFILIPLDDEEEELKQEEKEEVQEEPAVVEECNEEQLQEEMAFMSNIEDIENIEETKTLTPILTPTKEALPKKEPKSKLKNRTMKTDSVPLPSESVVIEDTKDEEADQDIDEDNPTSPWYCWVDDATVSSIASKKSDPEALSADVTPSPTPLPEVVEELASPAPLENQNRLSVQSINKPGSKQSVSASRKASGLAQKKRKGNKLNPPDAIAAELPPPPPPPPPVVEEVVEEVTEEEPPPKPVLPSYICPSSVMKSTQTEIKLWLHKSTFSAANRLLPIY